MSKIDASLAEDVNAALKVVKQGGVILCPTDTIWGLSCDATNEKAVARIFELKKRNPQKALIVLLDNENKLSRYVKEVPDVAWQLMEAAVKPLTIVYSKAMNLAPNVPAADGSIGVRVVKSGFCHLLAHKLGKALVSTSANLSGEQFNGLFSDIDETLKSAVDYIALSGRSQSRISPPSQVIKLENGGQVQVLRR